MTKFMFVFVDAPETRETLAEFFRKIFFVH